VVPVLMIKNLGFIEVRLHFLIVNFMSFKVKKNNEHKNVSEVHQGCTLLDFIRHFRVGKKSTNSGSFSLVVITQK
jgi:hypothetical protein